ncbi:MAG: type II toxin-antitoxin system Phd/YefM family antitoxin [Planctomycetes bacterium]|nr:type II toxin-antitoxin system Phd/YefM family antitoxin [Planctomycetota bacterium]
MKRPNVQHDILPLSEFRTRMAELVERTNKTGQPLILTQRGRSVAVVMSPREFEDITYRDRLIRAVREAEESLDRGEGMSHEEAKAWIKRRIEKRAKARADK